MKSFSHRPVCAALALAALATTFTATAASAQFAPLIASQIQARTPSCGANPDFPVIGRVAAYYAGSSRSVRMAFVGCFPSYASCEAWRREAMRPLNPPVQQNRCEARY